MPPGLDAAETWNIPVHQDSEGLALVIVGAQRAVNFSGGPVSQAVRLEVALTVKSLNAVTTYQNLQAEVFRKSPVGDLYSNIRTQGLAAAFPTTLVDPKTSTKAEEKARARRPSFGDAPAAK
jgi:hypothetical protein